MSSCDMQGYATSNDLESLYSELIRMTKEQRKNKPYALFICGKGFLNGEEALNYLKKKWNLQ